MSLTSYNDIMKYTSIPEIESMHIAQPTAISRQQQYPWWKKNKEEETEKEKNYEMISL